MADSELLLTALERRLQIDRTLSLSPLRPVASPSDSPRSARAPITSATPAPREAAPTLAARLPLGQIVSARVVEVPHADHVIAEVDRWRIELAWPKGNGPTPSPGQDIDLRVLAHRPMLLFQSVLAEPDTATLEDLDRDASASTHLSSNALQLQRQAVAQSAAPGTSSGPGPLRFTIPILEIERVLLDDSPREDRE
jgi:hypothetical protein